MLKFSPIAVICLCAFEATQAQPELKWVRQFGTSASDFPMAMARDAAGGLLVTGPTAGGLGGPSAGGMDVFLARYDAGGGLSWSAQLGCDSNEESWSAAAVLGGWLVAGHTDGALQGTNAGDNDAFVARYSAWGGKVWVRQFGSADSDFARAVATGPGAGAYVAGFTGGDLGGVSAGGNDGFVARIAGTGGITWIRQFGSAGDDQVYAAAPDGVGGVYVAGYTSGDLGGANAGGADSFIVHYNAAGNQLWARQFGTPVDDFVRGGASDGAGGVFVGGFTYGDLGGPSAGGGDAFLVRYGPTGQQVWARQFGTAADETALALASAAGDVLVGGETYGDLGGVNAGDQDGYIARYDAAGNQEWAVQLGTAMVESAWGVAPGVAGGAYLTGSTNGNLDGTNLGLADGYLARFAPCYADCDGNGTLDADDVLCFLAMFQQGSGDADCTGDGVVNVLDLVCFQQAFIAGCP